MAKMDSGAVVDAIVDFKKAADLQPKNPLRVCNYGVALMANKQYSDAIIGISISGRTPIDVGACASRTWRRVSRRSPIFKSRRRISIGEYARSKVGDTARFARARAPSAEKICGCRRPISPSDLAARNGRRMGEFRGRAVAASQARRCEKVVSKGGLDRCAK